MYLYIRKQFVGLFISGQSHCCCEQLSSVNYPTKWLVIETNESILAVLIKNITKVIYWFYFKSHIVGSLQESCLMFIIRTM